jgi:hypothetical protein
MAFKSEQSQDGNVTTYAYAGNLLSKVTGASEKASNSPIPAQISRLK